MEIRTTVRNFSEQIKNHHIPLNTCIRIIVNEFEPIENKTISPFLPVITPEEQRYQLNLMPNEYYPEDSDELIRIIEESHVNTDDFCL